MLPFSSVGSRLPGKVKALINLDAGYPYASYNIAHTEPLLDRAVAQSLNHDVACSLKTGF
jgi:hypothetical protein